MKLRQHSSDTLRYVFIWSHIQRRTMQHVFGPSSPHSDGLQMQLGLSSGFAAPGDRPLFDTDAWSRRRGHLLIAPSVCSSKSASEGTGREPRIFRRKRGVGVYEFHKVLKFEVVVTRFRFCFITSVHPGRMNQQQTLCEPVVRCCCLPLNGTAWRKVQEGWQMWGRKVSVVYSLWPKGLNCTLLSGCPCSSFNTCGWFKIEISSNSYVSLRRRRWNNEW